MLGVMMIVFTLLSVVTIGYDIYITVKIEGRHSDNILNKSEEKLTREQNVYTQLVLIGRFKLIIDVLLFIVVCLTWLNRLLMDAYLFSNPISFVVLSVTTFFLIFEKAYD